MKKTVDWSWTKRVNKLLKETGITKQQLALVSGIPTTTLSRWLSDSPTGKGPNKAQREKFAELFVRSEEYLFDGINVIATPRYIPVITLTPTLTIEQIHCQIKDLTLADEVLSCPTTTTEKAFAVRVMSDAFDGGIHNQLMAIPVDSLLVFDRDMPLKPGKPAIFNVKGKIVMRVWQQIDGENLLTLPNLLYSQQYIKVDDVHAVLVATATLCMTHL